MSSFSQKTNKQINDILTFHFLLIKLNGAEDICRKIISLKDEYELNTIKESYLENDFYNWLNHDITIRSNYSLENISLELKEYYNNNSKILGLEDYYNGFVRTKSLSECYKSNWWRSTKKNFNSWCKIHYFINFNKIIKIHNMDNEEVYNNLDEELKLLDDNDNGRWRKLGRKKLGKYTFQFLFFFRFFF